MIRLYQLGRLQQDEVRRTVEDCKTGGYPGTLLPTLKSRARVAGDG